jgi:hypothetical protein
VDFLQMLTNAAFDPELSGATKATQALAVSISQPWILEAHDTFTAQYRNKIEEKVELVIDGFKTSTSDGSDETEQLQKHDKYWSGLLENELKKLTFPTAAIAVGVIIAILSLIIFKIGLIGIAGVLIGGIIIWSSINSHKNSRKKTIETITEQKKKSKEVLRGCIAETVDYRKEFALEDAKAEILRQTLSSVAPGDFSGISRDTRNILQPS